MTVKSPVEPQKPKVANHYVMEPYNPSSAGSNANEQSPLAPPRSKDAKKPQMQKPTTLPARKKTLPAQKPAPYRPPPPKFTSVSATPPSPKSDKDSPTDTIKAPPRKSKSVVKEPVYEDLIVKQSTTVSSEQEYEECYVEPDNVPEESSEPEYLEISMPPPTTSGNNKQKSNENSATSDFTAGKKNDKEATTVKPATTDAAKTNEGVHAIDSSDQKPKKPADSTDIKENDQKSKQQENSTATKEKDQKFKQPADSNKESNQKFKQPENSTDAKEKDYKSQQPVDSSDTKGKDQKFKLTADSTSENDQKFKPPETSTDSKEKDQKSKQPVDSTDTKAKDKMSKEPVDSADTREKSQNLTISQAKKMFEAKVQSTPSSNKVMSPTSKVFKTKNTSNVSGPKATTEQKSGENDAAASANGVSPNGLSSPTQTETAMTSDQKQGSSLAAKRPL